LKSYHYGSNIFVTFFDLYFIGSVCLDGHLTDLSMASILFAATGLGDGCSAGVYQTNCKKHQQKCFFRKLMESNNNEFQIQEQISGGEKNG